MGKDILDHNIKDTKKKIAAMVKVAGAFIGGYDYYKKRNRKNNSDDGPFKCTSEEKEMCCILNIKAIRSFMEE